MPGRHRLGELGKGRTAAATDVVAGAEPVAVRLHEDDLDAVVALGVLQAVLDVPHHRRVLRVRLLRPVQDDPRDGAILFVDHGLELSAFHCVLSVTRVAHEAEVDVELHRFGVALQP